MGLVTDFGGKLLVTPAIGLHRQGNIGAIFAVSLIDDLLLNTLGQALESAVLLEM